MRIENMILVSEFCTNYNIEISFISLLREYGLIDISIIEDNAYIKVSQLQDLEKIIRLHYDLDINLEGIETIIYLLNRINELHNEISLLQKKLLVYDALLPDKSLEK